MLRFVFGFVLTFSAFTSVCQALASDRKAAIDSASEYNAVEDLIHGLRGQDTTAPATCALANGSDICSDAVQCCDTSDVCVLAEGAKEGFCD